MSDRALAIAQNCATNGRLFCCMLFVASLVAYAKGGTSIDLAVWSSVPVGLSIVADQLPVGKPASNAVVGAMYALCLLIVLLLLTVVR